MNMILIFVAFCEVVSCSAGSLIKLEGSMISPDDGTDFLFFNCTALSYPVNPYAEFLINGSSIASFMYIVENNECVFLNSEKNCKDLCKCSSNGRVFTWTYPIPSVKADICYSCHIFLQNDSPEQAQICINGTDLDEKKDKTRLPVREGKSSSTDKAKSTIENRTPMFSSIFRYSFRKTNSFTVESTGDKIDTTQSTWSSIKSTETKTKLLLSRQSTENILLTVPWTNEGGSFNTVSPFQSLFYYGPFVGVGVFCLFVLGCNIMFMYKCRTQAVVIQQISVNNHQHAQLRIQSTESSHDQSEIEMVDYESIDERGMIDEAFEICANERDNKSQCSTHLYLDVIETASESIPYQTMMSIPDIDEHNYCAIDQNNCINDQNSNNDSSNFSVSSKSIPSSFSESQTSYIDIHSSNSENSAPGVLVLSVANQ